MGQNQVRLIFDPFMSCTNSLIDLSLSHVGVGQPGIRFAEFGVELNGALRITGRVVEVGRIGTMNVAHCVCSAQGSVRQRVPWIQRHRTLKMLPGTLE